MGRFYYMGKNESIKKKMFYILKRIDIYLSVRLKGVGKAGL